MTTSPSLAVTNRTGVVMFALVRDPIAVALPDPIGVARRIPLVSDRGRLAEQSRLAAFLA